MVACEVSIDWDMAEQPGAKVDVKIDGVPLIKGAERPRLVGTDLLEGQRVVRVDVSWEGGARIPVHIESEVLVAVRRGCVTRVSVSLTEFGVVGVEATPVCLDNWRTMVDIEVPEPCAAPSAITSAGALREHAEPCLEGMERGVLMLQRAMTASRARKDIILLNCLSEKLAHLRGLTRVARMASERPDGQPEALAHAAALVTIAFERARRVLEEARVCV